MKKLIIISFILGLIFSSCEKENLEQTNSKKLTLLKELEVSKVKLKKSPISVELNSKTGETSITSETDFLLSYRLFKEDKDVYILTSSMNPTKYLDKFVPRLFNEIPLETKYKLELDLFTINGVEKIEFKGKRK